MSRGVGSSYSQHFVKASADARVFLSCKMILTRISSIDTGLVRDFFIDSDRFQPPQDGVRLSWHLQATISIRSRSYRPSCQPLRFARMHAIHKKSIQLSTEPRVKPQHASSHTRQASLVSPHSRELASSEAMKVKCGFRHGQSLFTCATVFTCIISNSKGIVLETRDFSSKIRRDPLSRELKPQRRVAVFGHFDPNISAPPSICPYILVLRFDEKDQAAGARGWERSSCFESGCCHGRECVHGCYLVNTTPEVEEFWPFYDDAVKIARSAW